jgi:hypothetical protein
LRLPRADPRRLARVHQYLTRRRGLDASLLEPLLESGQLYADGYVPCPNLRVCVWKRNGTINGSRMGKKETGSVLAGHAKTWQAATD